MDTSLGFLLAGLGGGAVIAVLGLGLVLTQRSSGVVNFAHAAMGTYVAFAYFEFRATGDLVLPVLGLPARLHLLPRPTVATALVVTVGLAAALGAAVYLLVFRPLRNEPPLARVVASLGLLLYLQEVVRLRFPLSGAGVVERRPLLASTGFDLLGTRVTSDRLVLAALAVGTAAVLTVVFRVTRFGLATRAAAEDERAALLLGLSPDRLGLASWVVAAVLGGVAVILIEPIAGLDPTTTPLLVVPALAAALLGHLRSFALTAATGLGIGIVQSLVLGRAVRPDQTWIPDWLPTTGVQQAVPVVAIIGVLLWRGDALPDRAAVRPHRLPPSPRPRHVPAWTVLGATAAVVALTTFGTTLRHGLIVSAIAGVVSLSVVVATGYVGQISLAPLALAGIAGFTAVRLVDRGLPFPVAAFVAAGIATVVGVVVAWPATRVRGASLAVTSLAIAVALEQLVLASEALSGGAMGRRTPRPTLFGWDLGVAAPGADNFRPPFAALCLAVLGVAAVAVAGLRRSRVGLRWLAVRANERAAAAAGIDVARAKLGAFAVSSLLAGLAGVLTAFSVTTLSPTSFMVVGSLVAVALTYLAGISSVSGALVAGALAPGGLLTAWLGGDATGSTDGQVLALSGLVLIVAAVLAPAGLSGVLRRGIAALAARSRRRDRSAAVPAATGAPLIGETA